MSTRTMKMLDVGIAAIAFLLVTIPVLKSSVAYADQVTTTKTTGTTTMIETTTGTKSEMEATLMYLY